MKAILLSLMLACSAVVFGQTLPNPGFETVFTDSVGRTYPEEWSFDGFGGQSSTAHVASGSYSASIWNWYYYARAFMRNGVLSGSFSPIVSFADMGTPIVGKPTTLSGFYIYDTSATYSDHDSALVVVCLKRWNVGAGHADTIALTEKRLPATPTSGSMVPFEVDIQDLMPGADPDSIVVTFLSSVSGFCDTTTSGTCLYLFVDDLSLTITNAEGIAEKQPFMLFPNPAREAVTIRLGEVPADEIKVYDMAGKCVMTRSLPQSATEITLDVNLLPPGTYVAELSLAGTVNSAQKLLVR